ncbi:MAG TPA: (d)CMP kinase [Clostridia bacterium]|jgi:CMP/dCMP kinase|nr:(d)CMP kinase [Clostridia bacterium]
MNETVVSIAIDGPAGAGKSTIAKRVAAELGISYLDTGAMYRAVALACGKRGIALDDAERVGELLSTLKLDVDWQEGVQHVYIDGGDVSVEIRTEAMGRGASDVSKLPCVRDALASKQREIGRRRSVIMDGRDIGTYVMPYAPYKFYVTASSEERARRRMLQLEGKGQSADYETILKAIRERDAQDMGRSYVPLKQADDALLVDTTNMSIDEAVSFITKAVQKE